LTDDIKACLLIELIPGRYLLKGEHPNRTVKGLWDESTPLHQWRVTITKERKGGGIKKKKRARNRNSKRGLCMKGGGQRKELQSKERKVLKKEGQHRAIAVRQLQKKKKLV